MLLDGPAIAQDLGIDRALLRQWRRRHHLKARGTDSVGRTLYDYDEVVEVATRRGLVDANQG